MEEGIGPTHDHLKNSSDDETTFCASANVVFLTQKVIAEAIGTYFLVFVGCGSVALDKISGTVTFPGICAAWGLTVLVMAYSVGHISGGHFNPAVTVAFAIFRHFPWKEVPFYVLAQFLGSIFASGTLYLLLDVQKEAYFGTVPTGSNIQSLVMEFIASFLLMFVISAVATDNRSIGELAGIAIGMTIFIDILIAGQVSGASMNPVRSIGPALIMHEYKGLWVYIVGPLLGATAGAFAYNLIRFTDKPLREITKSSAFLKGSSRS